VPQTWSVVNVIVPTELSRSCLFDFWCVYFRWWCRQDNAVCISKNWWNIRWTISQEPEA